MKNPPAKEKKSAVSNAAEEEKYILRLYIAGKKRKSSKAIANLKQVCEEHLAGRRPPQKPLIKVITGVRVLELHSFVV